MGQKGSGFLMCRQWVNLLSQKRKSLTFALFRAEGGAPRRHYSG